MKSKISILIAVLALASCLKNDIVWESENAVLRPWEISAPLVKVHVPLYKTMDKEFDFDVFVNEKGVICIRYIHTESIKWGNDIGIQGYSSSNDPVPLVPFAPGDVDKPLPPIKIGMKSSEETGSYVKEAELSAGQISFTLSGTNGLSGTMQITIPELTNNNGEFTESINLSSSVASFPLKDYKMVTDENHDLNVIFTIDAFASALGSLGIEFEISEMDVSYLSGYFGEITKAETYEIEFDFFDELDFDGTFGFKEIEIVTAVTNMAGVPINFEADAYFTNKSGLNELLELEPDFKFDVPGATEKDVVNHTIEPAVKRFSTMLPEIEFRNGNYPDKLKFEFETTTNPHGVVKNFIAKNANNTLAEIDFTLTVPLYVKIEEFSRSDTVAFDYNDIINDDEEFSASVENITINLEIVNNMPFEITLSAIAIDAANNHVETILAAKTILFKKDKQNIPITLTKLQLEKFGKEDVKNIVLYTTAKTPNAGFIEIKEDSYLDIVVSMPNFKANIPNKF